MILRDDTDISTRSFLAIDGIHVSHLTVTGGVGRLLLTYNGVGFIAREAIVHSLDEARIICMAEGWPLIGEAK